MGSPVGSTFNWHHALLEFLYKGNIPVWMETPLYLWNSVLDTPYPLNGWPIDLAGNPLGPDGAIAGALIGWNTQGSGVPQVQEVSSLTGLAEVGGEQVYRIRDGLGWMFHDVVKNFLKGDFFSALAPYMIEGITEGTLGADVINLLKSTKCHTVNLIYQSKAIINKSWDSNIVIGDCYDNQTKALDLESKAKASTATQKAGADHAEAIEEGKPPTGVPPPVDQ